MFDGLCLKQQGMFSEAATSYIRMTNELSDLRSAMLLEQAAYCFLLSTPASPRKYGFHIVLAGYRYIITDDRGSLFITQHNIINVIEHFIFE